MGVISPNISLGVNLPFLSSDQNFYSQIISQLPTETLPTPNVKSLQNLNPTDSLGRVTGPLDSLWKALGQKLNINSFSDVKNFVNNPSVPGALNSSLESGLRAPDTSTSNVLNIAKSAVVLVANILVIVLELVLWALKGALGALNSGAASISNILIGG